MNGSETQPPHDGLIVRNAGKTCGAVTVLRGIDLDSRRSLDALCRFEALPVARRW
jgi:hypothetical protein